VGTVKLRDARKVLRNNGLVSFVELLRLGIARILAYTSKH
jgi:hypothetical protein